MALILQGRVRADDVGCADVQAGRFEQFAVAAELVAVLDEARAALLEQSRT